MTGRTIVLLAFLWLASLGGTGYLAGWYFGQGEYPEGTIVSTAAGTDSWRSSRPS